VPPHAERIEVERLGVAIAPRFTLDFNGTIASGAAAAGFRTKSWRQAGRGGLMNYEGVRNTAQGLALVGLARDLALLTDLNAVRTGIGAELRRLHSELLHKEISDRMVELIKHLDQQTEASPRGQDADDP
jgi:hypothetical protein